MEDLPPTWLRSVMAMFFPGFDKTAVPFLLCHSAPKPKFVSTCVLSTLYHPTNH